MSGSYEDAREIVGTVVRLLYGSDWTVSNCLYTTSRVSGLNRVGSESVSVGCGSTQLVLLGALLVVSTDQRPGSTYSVFTDNNKRCFDNTDEQ